MSKNIDFKKVYQERGTGPNESRSSTQIGSSFQNVDFFLSNIFNVGLEWRLPSVEFQHLQSTFQQKSSFEFDELKRAITFMPLRISFIIFTRLSLFFICLICNFLVALARKPLIGINRIMTPKPANTATPTKQNRQ